MNDIAVYFSEIRHVVTAAGLLAGALFDSNLAPPQEELPWRFKIFLIDPMIVALYYSHILSSTQLPYVFALLVASTLSYMALWSYFGYEKVLSARWRPWWRFWGEYFDKKEIRVIGGILPRDVKNVIKSGETTIQEYFEGTQYNKDRVWTRGSLVIVKVVLLLSYIAAFGFYILTIGLVVKLFEA
jgi:hypothetical protein